MNVSVTAEIPVSDPSVARVRICYGLLFTTTDFALSSADARALADDLLIAAECIDQSATSSTGETA